MIKTNNNHPIEKLFVNFLKESAIADKDLEYCLLQSTVEPTIRFKFGSWLNKHHGDRITLNLMEANRLDLVIGMDDQIYFIEFGHLLNILLHGAQLNKGKIQADSDKIVSKADKLIQKIRTIEKGRYNTFFDGKKINYLLCSLFSDIKVSPSGELFKANLPMDRLKSGTLFKYGNTFSASKTQGYFQEYLVYSYRKYDKKENVFLTGYTEFVVIPEQLSLHFRFDSI